MKKGKKLLICQWAFLLAGALCLNPLTPAFAENSGVGVDAADANRAMIPLENRGFEVGDNNKFSGWEQWSPENCKQETEIVHSGNASLRTWWVCAFWQDFKVTPGDEYGASVWAYIPANDPLKGTKYGHLKLEWLEADKSVISGVRSKRVEKGMETNKWQRIAIRGEAAPTAAYARIVIEFKEGEGDGVILWDDAEAVRLKKNNLFASAPDEKPFSEMLLDWTFKTGDNPEWKNVKIKNKSKGKPWKKIKVPAKWEDEGYANYDGYAWYRCTFDLPAIKPEPLYLILGKVDDADITYVNGERVGSGGEFPPAFYSVWDETREYKVRKEALKFGGKNVLAVRVYDGGQSGGIWAAGGSNKTPILPRLVNTKWIETYNQNAK